jgi:uncharacterized repeat protein (TIGR01451 family)
VYIPLVEKSFRSSPSDDGIWSDVDEASITGEGERLIIPQKYRTLAANLAILDALLASAPLENTTAAPSTKVVMTLPLPDGTLGWFRIEESPIMEASLAAKFPEIKTYRGQGLDDPTATARLDRTPAGFHAMILSSNGTIYIDPYRRGDTIHYISYYKRDYGNFWGKSLHEETLPGIRELEPQGPLAPTRSGPILRTYRLGMAATGEYTQFHGGTVAGALAAINTTMNRVNGIYERDLSVTMNLVANNDQIIYTHAITDPYTSGDVSLMINENQTNIDSQIGSANYDIGHVFDRRASGSSGLAGLGVVCNASNKARGVTGSSVPNQDPFDVDFVAHEMGHQFGANHTFNAAGAGSCSAGDRNGATAYEPGSGSTVMAYAGTCSTQDLQQHSNDNFHAGSIDEIINYLTTGTGSTCGAQTSTGNTFPTVAAGPNYTIPRQTPFTVNGTGSDAEGDALTFSWEEFDTGAAWTIATVLPNTDADGNPRPIFRAYRPAATTSRTFPALTSILDGSNSNNGESLPNIDRTMQFRLTVRDGRGGVNHDDMNVDVEDNAGPFAVTSPNTPVSWVVNTSETVTWDVANTDVAPVSCANVNILLSTDGGSTFPVALAANTANDGTEAITVPDNETSIARVKVACADNIFFDISDANFFIMRSADLAISKTDAVDPVVAGTTLTYTLTITNNGPSDASGVTMTDNLPAGVSLDSATPSQGTCSGADTVNCTIGNLINGGGANVTIVVDVSSSAAEGTILTNTAEVMSSEHDPDPDDNTASEETGVIRVADLSVIKTDAPDPVVAGTELTYTFQVANDGPSDASGVTLIDNLPAEVTYVSDNIGCTEAPAGTLACDLGDLGAGASIQFDVTVVVDPAAVFNAGGPTTITNMAEVFSMASDPDPTDNDTSVDTLVMAAADLEIVNFEAVVPPAEILVSEPLDVTLRKEITNNGPSAPMDVELTKTPTAPPDSIVTPTVSVAPELALGLDELRVVEEVFIIECGAASHHTFAFTNEIQPLNPEDADSDQSNNFATLDLDIECVVPVVINIKPGSDPNSINPRSRDVIPIAILTTAAGEYGTPIEFDATMIDPLSVRFGPRDDVWTETGGAFEAHNRGHIEDSKELDESTMDGDEDMVLHFHVQETGISTGDTEACAKGEWIDGSGNVHKFFGCDAVRTVSK